MSPDSPTPIAKQRAQAQFAQWAVTYDRSWLNELIFYPCIRACHEEILRWQRARGDAPLDVLDVGCGTGTMLALLARLPDSRRLVGLDYSDAMVARAQRKFAEHQHAEKLAATQGDAEHLPFDEASFDVIACCNSFHHYPDQATAIAGFQRVLRPGGMLLLLDGFRDNALGWIIFELFVAKIERHVRHATWREVKRMVTAAGFSELRQRKMNVLAPVLVNVAIK